MTVTMLRAAGRDHVLAFPSQEIAGANEMLQFNHIILRASLITPLYALARRPYSRLACQMYYIWVAVILAERASAIIEPQERKSAHNFHSSFAFVQCRERESGGGENADCNLCGPLCARNNGGFRA